MRHISAFCVISPHEILCLVSVDGIEQSNCNVFVHNVVLIQFIQKSKRNLNRVLPSDTQVDERLLALHHSFAFHMDKQCSSLVYIL